MKQLQRKLRQILALWMCLIVSTTMLPVNTSLATGKEQSAVQLEETAEHLISIVLPESGYKLRVGNLSSSYVYNDLEPETKTVGENGSEIVTFKLADKGNYYINVQAKNDDEVSYWQWIRPTEDTEYEITAEQLNCTEDFNKHSVIRDFSANKYDTGDLYLTADPTGQIVLENAGDEYQLEAFRNWQAIESISNAKIAEPDYHYEVIDANGNASDVVSVVPDEKNSGVAKIHANKEGIAIVLVTYDAMRYEGGFGGSKYSASWPENTGVVVVSVGEAANDIDTGMVIHAGENTTENKLYGDALDGELDVLYYEKGTEGASYSFKPEEGCTVSVLRPVLKENTLTYTGFSENGVDKAEDGSYVVTGLTAGKNIIRVTKDGKAAYQVIKVKEVETYYTYLNAEGEEITKEELSAGDQVKIHYNRLFAPANKFAAIYNMSTTAMLVDDMGISHTGKANQYLFASTEDAQTITVTIPKYFTGESYSLTGMFKETGFGSPYGEHRGTTHAHGKNPDFTALTRTAVLGQLPEAKFQVKGAVYEKAAVKLIDKETGNALNNEKFSIILQNAKGEISYPDAEGKYPVEAGSYQIIVKGNDYLCHDESFEIAEGHETEDIVISLTKAGANAWDGKTSKEPSVNENGIYQIGTAAELYWFANKVNAGNKIIDAELTSDIELTGYDWTPIGTTYNIYGGTFNGNNHSIYNLYGKELALGGLFGAVNGTVENLSIHGNLITSKTAAGGVTGNLTGSGKIENVKSYVNITDLGTFTNNLKLGGIAGNVNGSGTGVNIVRCKNFGTIKTSSAKSAGGIAGYAAGITSIANCVNQGEVEAFAEAGGIVGSIAGATGFVQNSYNLGKIKADSKAGGIAGSLKGKSATAFYTIENCYNVGTITANSLFGAIAGKGESCYEVKNSCYLAESAPAAVGEDGTDITTNAAALTNEQLKGNEGLAILGDGFKIEEGKNQGYPMPADSDTIFVTVSANDYTAVAANVTGASENGTVMRECIEVEAGTSASEAVLKAMEQAGIQITLESGYVSSINNLGSIPDNYMAGWCLEYNKDDFANYGLDYITLKDGDELGFHYSVNGGEDINMDYYGMPILAELTLGEHSIVLSKNTVYDYETYMSATYYYYDAGEGKAELTGNGSIDHPFIVPVTLEKDASTIFTPKYKLGFDEHYGEVKGLDGSLDFGKEEEPVTFSVISRGGKQTYYQVKLTQQTEPPKPEEPSDPSTPENPPVPENPPMDPTIRVSFRLIGSTQSDSKDFSYENKVIDAEYVTWIKTESYLLPAGSTVGDLLRKACAQADIRLEGDDSNYVSAIYAPSVLGNYYLAEFSNGQYSGWMYTVNGKHESLGINDCMLSNGDEVIWHYVNDYRYEIEDTKDASGTMGDASTWNLWLKAKDVNPTKDTPTDGITSGGAESEPEKKPAADDKKPASDEEAGAKKTPKLTVETKNITVSKSEKTFDLSAKFNGDQKLTYSSSNKKVAVVSKNGKVTIKGCGKAVISIQAKESEYFTKAKLTVTIKVVPDKVKALKVQKKNNARIISWKKEKEVDGYEIKLSSKKDMSNAKKSYIKSGNTVKKTVKAQDLKQDCYVQIRAYKIVDGKKLYGDWSAIKKA